MTVHQTDARSRQYDVHVARHLCSSPSTTTNRSLFTSHRFIDSCAVVSDELCQFYMGQFFIVTSATGKVKWQGLGCARSKLQVHGRQLDHANKSIDML